MKKIFAIAFFISAMCGFTFAQSALPTLEKVRRLKLLESTREDAIGLLNNEYFGYLGSKDFHYSDFHAEDANVRVFYSSGDCSDEDWNVSEWKITQIAVYPKIDITTETDIGIDYSKLRRENPYKRYKEKYIYHNKNLGVVVGTTEDFVESIIFSPSAKDFPRLCDKPEVRKYYASKKNLRYPSQKNTIICPNYPSNVTAIDLERYEIKTQSGDTQIPVSVTAVDPENDVLVYHYKVSAGKINGRGHRVVWDLSGVEPGIYKLTAIADDGCGFCGKWMTKTVVVK